MDIASIISSVANLGFPTILCMILFYRMEKTEERRNELQEKADERHKQELDKLSEAVNNNTLAITKLVIKLGGD